jgi:hypothetical protein
VEAIENQVSRLQEGMGRLREEEHDTRAERERNDGSFIGIRSWSSLGLNPRGVATTAALKTHNVGSPVRHIHSLPYHESPAYLVLSQRSSLLLTVCYLFGVSYGLLF